MTNQNPLVNFDIKTINKLKEETVNNLINKQAENIIARIKSTISIIPLKNYIEWIPIYDDNLFENNINYLIKNNFSIYEVYQIFDNNQRILINYLIIWDDIEITLHNYKKQSRYNIIFIKRVIAE